MKKVNEESRLDRIERGLELLLQGTSELRESQNRTDAQILELRESQKKTDAQLNKTDAQLNKTDAQIRKTEELLEKTIKKLDEIGRQLGDLGLVQGEVAEDLFYRNVRGLFKKDRDMIFVDVKRNLKKKGVGEYDIVAVNGGAVLVIEVKNKLQKRMVDDFVEKKLPRFKKIFPEYQGRSVFGGIGAWL